MLYVKQNISLPDTDIIMLNAILRLSKLTNYRKQHTVYYPDMYACLLDWD